MAAPSNEIHDKEMPLLDHLIELRNRLVYAIGALFVMFLVCYFFAADIFDFLLQPLADEMLAREVLADDMEGRRPRVIFTNLTEVFFTYVKVAFFAAAFIAFPIIASQFYLFVAPGLYKNEKHAFLPFLIATPILFFLGGLMVYYGIMPLAWKFFLSFQMPGGEGVLPIELEPRVGEYLGLVMKLIFAFGIAFQLPVALTLMAKVGIVSAEGLAKKRKFAIVIVFICAAVLTPPDVISQIGLALPILLLYEVSIVLARMVERRRKAEEEKADTAGDS